MKVKTITGSSIHAALAEARRLLGDNVVLLESTPPTDSEPARITVLADAATLREAAVPAQVARRAIEETAPLVQAGYGYGAIQRSQRGLQSQEENARLNESFSPAGDDRYQTPPAASSRVSPAARRPGRARLFPEAAEEIRPANPPGAPSSTVRLEKLFEAQLMLIHERLEDMERRLAGAVIGASQRWVTHPLFAALLAQGFQPATVASLFDSLVEKGFQVDEDEEKLKWSLANEVRHRLTMPAARQTNGTQVFIGPSGAGKTTLLLKLATHPDFFARRNPTIIAIRPEDTTAMPFQDPVELYRRFGLPVQSVQTEEEMHQALTRLASFDQVLIDTPPIPAHEGRARKMLQRVQRLIDGLMPVEVQFVLNATRALESFDATFMKRIPLRPSAVVLTHLDETPRWGRIAEWLIRLQLPVRFVSTGPTVPESLVAFSPTWFVEKMMDL